MKLETIITMAGQGEYNDNSFYGCGGYGENYNSCLDEPRVTEDACQGEYGLNECEAEGCGVSEDAHWPGENENLNTCESGGYGVNCEDACYEGENENPNPDEPADDDEGAGQAKNENPNPCELGDDEGARQTENEDKWSIEAW